MVSNGRPIFLNLLNTIILVTTCNEGLVTIYQNLIQCNSFRGLVIIHQSRGWMHGKNGGGTQE